MPQLTMGWIEGLLKNLCGSTTLLFC